MHVQNGVSTSRVWGEISVSMATNMPFWQIIFLFGCKFQKDDIATSEKY